jgi:hypothetical protein
MLQYYAGVPPRQSGATSDRTPSTPSTPSTPEQSIEALLTTTGLIAPEGTPVSQWSAAQRYAFVLTEAIKQLPAETAEKIQAMLSPESLATMEVITGAWLASHLVGVGEGADAVMVALGAVMLGPEIVQVSQDLFDFVSLTTNPRSKEDLQRASKHLARAVAVVGVDVAAAVLTHKATGATKAVINRPPPPSAVLAEGGLSGAGPGAGVGIGANTSTALPGVSVAVPGAGAGPIAKVQPATQSDVQAKAGKETGGAQAKSADIGPEARASLKRLSEKLDKEVLATKAKELPRIEGARQRLLKRLEVMLARDTAQPRFSEETRARLKAVHNALRLRLTPSDLTGALRDAVDMPVRRRGSGKGFDHSNEVENGLSSVAWARESLYAEYRSRLGRGESSTELTEMADALAEFDRQTQAFVEMKP